MSFHFQSLRLALHSCLCLQHLCHNLLLLNQERTHNPAINKNVFHITSGFYFYIKTQIFCQNCQYQWKKCQKLKIYLPLSVIIWDTSYYQYFWFFNYVIQSYSTLCQVLWMWILSCWNTNSMQTRCPSCQTEHIVTAWLKVLHIKSCCDSTGIILKYTFESISLNYPQYKQNTIEFIRQKKTLIQIWSL